MRRAKSKGKPPAEVPAICAAAILLAAGAIAAFMLIAGASCRLGQSAPVLSIEKGFAPMLEPLLGAAPELFRTWKIEEYDPAIATRDPAIQAYGFRIGTALSASDKALPYPDVHWGVSRIQSGTGAIALAVDPWLVFRRHSTEPLSRQRLAGGKGAEGSILLAGGEKDALYAWAVQELQSKPGVFPPEPESWQAKMGSLPGDGRFQPGAVTFTWEDAWPRLLSRESVWLYAPLSRVQSLPGNLTSSLLVELFPLPQGWNEYGIQARVLWAIPFGKNRDSKKIKVANAWFGRAAVQTEIAGILKWAPAQGQARATNPLAHEAQRLWLGSSYLLEVKK